VSGSDSVLAGLLRYASFHAKTSLHFCVRETIAPFLLPAAKNG
jgi:hypothetical protein